jgi:Rps23 Pro-64 3,4-dihydroxylase Tpa1-like proline 4-hydroxylase
MSQIYQWNEFLTQEEIELVDSEMSKGSWKFGHKETNSNPEVRTFWGMDLKFSEQLEVLFRSKMQIFLGKTISSNMLYANGQAHSQAAWVHFDVDPSKEGNYSTLIYYVHKKWRPEYGGHLVILDGNTIKNEEPTVIASIFPKSNSAVLIDAKLYHMALDPSVYCKEQRVSIAYKFKIED